MVVIKGAKASTTKSILDDQGPQSSALFESCDHDALQRDSLSSWGWALTKTSLAASGRLHPPAGTIYKKGFDVKMRR